MEQSKVIDTLEMYQGGWRWIGSYGVEDGGGLGFVTGGEGVLAPTEYEWGNGGRRGTKGEQCFGLGRACL